MVKSRETAVTKTGAKKEAKRMFSKELKAEKRKFPKPAMSKLILGSDEFVDKDVIKFRQINQLKKPKRVQPNGKDLRREIRSCIEENQQVLKEAETVNKAIETVTSYYKESKQIIKIRLCSNANEYINLQQLEKAKHAQIIERIQGSETEMNQIEPEVEKIAKFNDEITRRETNSWFIRWLRYLY